MPERRLARGFAPSIEGPESLARAGGEVGVAAAAKMSPSTWHAEARLCRALAAFRCTLSEVHAGRTVQTTWTKPLPASPPHN